MRMLEPRRLLTFREVAHRGSFSRAADALALTQPAVSQQVAALERQIGVRLLDRGPGGPAPTEAGALLLAHADAIAERLAQADAQLAEPDRRRARDPADRRVPERARLDRPRGDRAAARAATGGAGRGGRGLGAGQRRRGGGGRAARRRLLPGPRDAAARAGRHRAPRAGRGADARAAPGRPSAGGPPADRARGAGGRAVDRAVARPPRLPRVRRRRLRAAHRVRVPRPAGDRRAGGRRARGHARAASCSPDGCPASRRSRSRTASRAARSTRSPPPSGVRAPAREFVAGLARRSNAARPLSGRRRDR